LREEGAEDGMNERGGLSVEKGKSDLVNVQFMQFHPMQLFFGTVA
jgi:hypothetical protein